MAGLRCHAFIGGTDLKRDKQHLRECHVVVGTPGRVQALMSLGVLNTDALRMVVLDEADQLLHPSFHGTVSFILSRLPPRRQVTLERVCV